MGTYAIILMIETLLVQVFPYRLSAVSPLHCR